MRVNERTGEYALDLHERDDIKRAHQMMEGARKHEIERGDELHAKKKLEKVVRKADGRRVDYNADLLEQSKHAFRPAGRNGGAPSLRFGLSDAFSGYERGPDGMWFVWNGGWEPTKLWAHNVTSPQRDPDGNEWVERHGEWFLGEEVE